MSSQEDIALMAHLMRRAGFGASRAELEERCARGYETTVEELLNPGDDSGIDEDELYRYFPQFESSLAPVAAQTEWVYRMVNTRWPLKEKMALFWHQLFATGNSKVDNPPELLAQIGMFRREGLTNFPNLLVKLAQNPAMIYWLDNNGNHYGSINENWGRELLELFSMGVGHYSEEDIKEASRAFTGWTLGTKPPRQPVGRFYWSFEFKPEDHDYGEKEFLGHTGNFDGDDIITSSSGRKIPLDSWLATCTTSSWPTSPRFRPGTSPRPTIRLPSTRWSRPTWTRMPTSGPFCGPCSTPTSSRTPASST